MSTAQLTLTGEETEAEREKPRTFMWCGETEQWVLRSERASWPHDLYESKEAFIESLNDTSDPDDLGLEDDDEAEKVGGVYEIELSYNVDFRFHIPAYSEHEAKEHAELLVEYPSNCADMFQVHSQENELKELFEDSPEIPDDWDPYGSTPLWDVYGEDSATGRESDAKGPR